MNSVNPLLSLEMIDSIIVIAKGLHVCDTWNEQYKMYSTAVATLLTSNSKDFVTFHVWLEVMRTWECIPRMQQLIWIMQPDRTNPTVDKSYCGVFRHCYSERYSDAGAFPLHKFCLQFICIADIKRMFWLKDIFSLETHLTTKW